MEGLTAAVVGFIFACIAFPRLVRNRSWFYIAIVATMAALFFKAMAVMFMGYGLFRVLEWMGAILLASVFVLLILATGGLSLEELGSNISEAFRGVGQEKPQGGAPGTGAKPRGQDEEAGRVVYDIHDNASPPPPPGPRKPDEPKDQSIPLE